jgi:hypothetical protein
MKFTYILFTLVASLFLIDSTLALPAPKKCRAVCRAARKVGSGIKKAATSKVGKVLGGIAAVALTGGIGGAVYAATVGGKAIHDKRKDR